MKYPGSKARIAGEILSRLELFRKPGQVWVEPFCGGCNMLERVDGPRIAADSNPAIIALFSSLQNGWIPPSTVTEQQYKDVRIRPSDYHPAMEAFVGVGCSFGGKWWGGYARGKNGKGEPRNYAAEQSRALLKQAGKLQGVTFICAPYNELEIPPHSVIYCDPPYRGTIGYRDKFDHDAFWFWAGGKAAEGHFIAVSEYEAPAGWDCIWSRDISAALDCKRGGSKRTATERLFIKGVLR